MQKTAITSICDVRILQYNVTRYYLGDEKYIGPDSFPMQHEEYPPGCIWPSVKRLNMMEVMPAICLRADFPSKGAGHSIFFFF